MCEKYDFDYGDIFGVAFQTREVKCTECGKLSSHKDCGEMADYFCPDCQALAVSTKECKNCGAKTSRYELYSGYCKDCITKKYNDLDLLEEVTRGSSDIVNVVFPYGAMFTQDKINEIIREYAENNKVDCAQAIIDNIDWFGEQVEYYERRLKNETPVQG